MVIKTGYQDGYLIIGHITQTTTECVNPLEPNVNISGKILAKQSKAARAFG